MVTTWVKKAFKIYATLQVFFTNYVFTIFQLSDVFQMEVQDKWYQGANLEGILHLMSHEDKMTQLDTVQNDTVSISYN